MCQAVDGEPTWIGLLFEDEPERRASSAGPLQEQGDIELAEALAEALLERLFADGEDAHVGVDGLGLGFDRLPCSRSQ